MSVTSRARGTFRPTILITVLALCPLSACGSNGNDKLASRVEDAADNRADALENRADALEAQANALDRKAGQVRVTGQRRSDAIDAANLNTQLMSNEQKDSIVANQAPAVR